MRFFQTMSGFFKAFHEILALKGHDFSRAKIGPIKIAALAAEGMLAVPKTFPQGLKPGVHFGALAARLKSCPFKAKRFFAGNILCCLTILFIATSLGAQTKPKPASGYSIAGTVVNAASGEPVRRATVSVQDEESRQIVESVETDSEGRFSLDGLSAGKYPLTASKRGFLTGFYDEHDGGFYTAIVTGADQQTSGLVFRLTPGASLHGVVTGDGGDPVEGASVMLFLKPRHHNPGDRVRKVEDATTDDTGAYEFDGLAAGEYLVAVNAMPWYALHDTIVGKPPSESSANTALDVTYPVTYFDSTTDEASATPISISGAARKRRRSIFTRFRRCG